MLKKEMDKIHTYLIIGCGRFGSRAVEKLLQKDSRAKIIVVEKSRKALQKVARLPIQTEVGDGIIYLSKFLSEGQKTHYIIPAVPFHLAFEFILSQLTPLGAKKREVPMLPELPNPMMGHTGDLYTSFADFLCLKTVPNPLIAP